MAHGKDAARDLRYGRRGGAWAAPTQTDDHWPTQPVPVGAELTQHLHQHHDIPADLIPEDPEQANAWHHAHHRRMPHVGQRHQYPGIRNGGAKKESAA